MSTNDRTIPEDVLADPERLREFIDARMNRTIKEIDTSLRGFRAWVVVATRVFHVFTSLAVMVMIFEYLRPSFGAPLAVFVAGVLIVALTTASSAWAAEVRLTRRKEVR